MTNKQMNKIFEEFFGETLTKADVVIAEAKENKKEEININQDLGLDKIYQSFFGDVMRRTEKF